ncbi:hypothetical protein CERSUDRAFT_103931 [Gelatoporia subvermispora B]|uniref:Uncharacterized protein n=1 Tax=Ceriporiopsis subvermispora (strain B) TaxID=914234 RepID=M2Q0Z9_CERS8|nr:hypothetical protein CERSUDRAFT_89756 [Gelatoporia subvermispora B]EMD40057.1 hypothetical protein CERSUDRAFT_103931 [Gelatoporia subvermispora B]
MSATADTPRDVHTCYVEPASRQPRLHIALDSTTRSGRSTLWAARCSEDRSCFEQRRIS